MLRDWRFRQALQWAVDRERLTQVVYNGMARPGDTVIAPGYSTEPGLALVAAGESRPTPSTWRGPVSCSTRPATATRTTTGSATTRQTHQASPLGDERVRDESGGGKLIAGWFRQIGLKIDVATMPMAAMYDRIYNTEGDHPAPDFDLCQSGWYLGLDPGQSLSYFTTEQIGGMERLWVRQRGV